MIDYRSGRLEKDLCFSKGLVRRMRQIRVTSENDKAYFLAAGRRVLHIKKAGRRAPVGLGDFDASPHHSWCAMASLLERLKRRSAGLRPG
jgi:hypothetical protein